MVRGALLLLLLVLFGAFDVPGIDRVRIKYLAKAGNTCNACRMHEEIRALSLEAIKEQILNKLGLKQAPNMTGRALPRIPPISKLMDMYGMQADQPQPLEPGTSHYEEIDEYAAKTESVFALAQPRKFHIFFRSFPVRFDVERTIILLHEKSIVILLDKIILQRTIATIARRTLQLPYFSLPTLTELTFSTRRAIRFVFPRSYTPQFVTL